jgi:putative FmdB family regulatory protein
MPTYEYECEKCTYRFELKSRFDEHIENPCCPICKGKVRQLYSPAGLLFKGSGFYVTDSRPSEEGKTDKVGGVKKEEEKPGKVEGLKKEDNRTDKVEDGRKEENKAKKADVIKKGEGKADKVQRSKKEERK